MQPVGEIDVRTPRERAADHLRHTEARFAQATRDAELAQRAVADSQAALNEAALELNDVRIKYQRAVAEESRC